MGNVAWRHMMLRKNVYLVLSLVLLAVCVGTAAYVLVKIYAHSATIAEEIRDEEKIDELPEEEQTGGVPISTVRPYGEVSLSIGESAIFENGILRPFTILEESRCPSNVTCIQAGTFRVAILVGTGSDTSTTSIALGESITTGTERITLVSADPYPVSDRYVSPNMYTLTFLVEAHTEVLVKPFPGEGSAVPPKLEDPKPGDGCYSGGCSGQVCTDDPGSVSTCEYIEEYQCYRTATCERQASGECGWTETPALTQCIMDARAKMMGTSFIE